MVKLEGKNGPRWFEVGIVVGAYYQDMGPKRDWSHGNLASIVKILVGKNFSRKHSSLRLLWLD